MTTTPNPLPADATALLDAMTRAIAATDDTDDLFDALIGNDTLELIFTPAAIERFCLAFDCCPIHRTDLDSCADDELPECAHFRAAPRNDL